MKNNLTLYFLALFILSLATLSFVHSPEKELRADVTEHITLYSNGKFIGDWEGIGRGRLEGDTYVFKTERGAFGNEIRIRGDFVVETMNN